MPPAAAPGNAEREGSSLAMTRPRRGRQRPTTPMTAKLKTRYWLISCPLRAQMKSPRHSCFLLIHHVSMLKCRLLPVDGIHIFPQRSNPLHRDIQLIAAINGLIKCRRQ